MGHAAEAFISPILRAFSRRTTPERTLRELAQAKIDAEQVYLAAVQADRTGLTADQLIDYELSVRTASRAYLAASRALNEAA